jgi:hypothetical protein
MTSINIDTETLEYRTISLSLKIVYYQLQTLIPGSTLAKEEITNQPNIRWENANSKSLYTLYLVNPDVPSRDEPLEAEWQHWTVHNIHGDRLTSGDQIVEYNATYDHEESSGLKRFVALIYKQKEKLDADGLTYFDSKTLRTNNDSRGDLHVKTVSSYQGLGSPVAGNFFYVDLDHAGFTKDTLNQGGNNTDCKTNNDCKQQYECLSGICVEKEVKQSLANTFSLDHEESNIADDEDDYYDSKELLDVLNSNSQTSTSKFQF